jgi:NAD+ kinase
MMRLKIIPNPKKPWAVQLARELGPFLKGAGHRVVRKQAEATICIGGDGTILYASHKGRLEGTILGIGGDKSYICQIHNNDWKEKALAALSSGTQGIMTLECVIGPKRFIALNDIVIHATHYRVAEMDVTAGGSKTSFEGDGMIASTPLGSTGYAFSAGGAKLAPSERKISLVPICPYRRAFSPSMLSEETTIEITVGNDCAFITDGIFVRRLRKGEKAVVRKGPDMPFFSGVGTWE